MLLEEGAAAGAVSGRAGAGRARAAVQEPTESALPSFELPGLLCQLMHSAVLI